jgi:heme/copper-type cytochrome/quinol oxidase subunit 4
MRAHEHSSDDAEPGKERKRPFMRTPTGLALCVFLAAAGMLLWFEHRAHVAGALPLLLPLAICLGMHFFMHRGHGGHGGGRHEQ